MTVLNCVLVNLKLNECISHRSQVFGIELAFDEAALGRQLLTPEWVEHVYTNESADVTVLLFSRMAAHVLEERGARPLPLLKLEESEAVPSLSGEAVRVVHFPNGICDSLAAVVDLVDGVEGGLITYHVTDENGQKAVSSGAPLVDSQGRAVGIHRGQKDEDPNAFAKVAVKLADVVSAFTLAYERYDFLIMQMPALYC